MGVITFSQYLLNAVSSRWFPNFLEAVGTKSFLLFAVLSLLGAAYVWKCVPETRGKSLEEIEDYWRNRESATVATSATGMKGSR
jgi:SP family galactose:H+ symporter-like MFS transporter